ncbi:PAS domain-containing protein [Mucilaginibacter sp. PAMB04274]|uniref:PAS domain-containing protein n=1 Tax=Mucilaginibacter sp. PAMB04274 TaxID=3138568 RepID=UPI0031F71385
MKKKKSGERTVGRKAEEEYLPNELNYEDEVISSFGLMPNFFRTSNPNKPHDLWAFTKSAYLDNPLPAVFKERLYVHLSRFCRARYCIVRHAGFLMGLGNSAGDSNAIPESMSHVITLLKRPTPSATTYDQLLNRLEVQEQPLPIPLPGSQIEADLFDALTVVFLEPHRAERVRQAICQSLGTANFEALILLLTYVRTAHFWIENHPEVTFEPDMVDMMDKHPELSHLLLNTLEAEIMQTSEPMKQVLDELANAKELENKTAKALSKYEEKYRSLFNAIDDGFVLLEMIYSGKQAVDMRYLEVNPAFKKLSNLSDIVGKTAYEVNPLMESYWLQTADAVAADGKPVKLEAYVKALDRWLNVSFMRLDDDNTHLIAAVFNDVTDRKRSEINNAFLADLSNDFAHLKSPERILRMAAIKIASHFKLTRCFFADINQANFTGQIACDWQLEGVAGVNTKRSLPLNDLIPDGCYEDLLNGEAVVINDSHLDIGNNLGGSALLNSQSYIITPIIKSGHLCFLTCILYPFARTWRKDEIRMMKELTERIWLRLARARAEEDLRHREAELTRVQEIGGVGGVDIDISTGIRTWHSAEYLRLHGLPPGTKLETHQDWINRLHPDDRDQASKTLQEVIENPENTYQSEYRIIRPIDGRVRWIFAKGDVEFDSDGQPARLIGAHIDITDRKLVEETQRQNQARHAFLVKFNDALRLVVDPLRIQAVSARMLGEYMDVNSASYGEVNGNKLSVHDSWTRGIDALTGDIKFADFGKALIEDYLQGHTVVIEDIETDNRITPEERNTWRNAHLRASVAVMLIKNGRWLAAFGVQATLPRKWSAIEIELIEEVAERTWAAVERAQVEESLRKSEQLFRTVVDIVPDLLWLNDPSGKPYWYNQRWLTYTGQTLEEAVENDWYEVISHDDKPLLINEIRSAFDKGRPIRQEHRIRSVKGEYRWFSVQVVPVYKITGEIWQWVGAATDIHERKEVERQLEDMNMILERQVSERTHDLEESQKLLSATLDSTLDMIQVFEAVRDEHGKIVDFVWILNNDTSNKNYGNVIGKSLLQNNPGVVKAGIFNSFVEVTESGISQQYEIHYVYEQFNGWFHQSVVKLNDGVATSTADITERKKADQQLNETNSLLQSVFDTTLIGMACHTAERDENGQLVDFRIKMVNKELERLSERNDMVGKLYSHVFPGVRKTGLFDLMLKVMETGEPGQLEYSYPYDGFNKWFSSMFVKMDDGLVATNLDITERKNAEEERLKSLTLLQETEEVALLGSWEYNRLSEVFSWSDGMYSLFNVAKGTLIQPDKYIQFIIDEDRLIAEQIIDFLKTGTGTFDESFRIKVGGDIKVVKLKATAIYDNGTPVKILGINMDTTATQMAEEKIKKLEIEQQQEVLRAILSTQEEERKRIAESLHNGLGQLLYGVKLSLDQINLTRVKRPEENSDALQQTKRLLSDSIRETRRISHELMPSILEDFGLKEAIEDVCRQLSGAVRFQCTFNGVNRNLDKYLEIAIYRIIQELMINVIKHAYATIADAQIDVNEQEVVLTVKDNGKGFDTSKVKVKGIGLASIRSKVNLLNGELKIISEIGVGSTVKIRIPNKVNN